LGCHRPRIPDRIVLDKLIHVLLYGCGYRRIADATCSATTLRAAVQGAAVYGFTGELWTLDRIAEVIWRLTGVRHHPAHVWALLRHRMGWTVQRPQRRASERDQAAIDHWVKANWPRIKNARRRGAVLCFFDDSGLRSSNSMNQ
jgi:Winged helix-turn helix